jgi:Sap, sulfolipid-1-addressing protein
MSAVMVSLLPLIIGASVGGLAWIIMTLLLLRSEGGLIKAVAFASGAITVRVLQFILFGYVFGVAIDTGGYEGFNLIRSTLLLVAGILLFITAAKTWSKGADPDAPPPRWMKALSGVSELTAFGMALLLMTVEIKQWVFTLSAIAVIDNAHLGLTGSILAYLFFIAAAQSLMLIPIVGSAVAPAQSAKMVKVPLDWLERNNRVITIVVSLIFSAWFLTQGTSGLLAHAAETAITKTPMIN